MFQCKSSSYLDCAFKWDRYVAFSFLICELVACDHLLEWRLFVVVSRLKTRVIIPHFVTYSRHLPNSVRQSAFLMNLVIQAAGQETMLQLLQWRSLIKQAVKRPLINVNSKSRRYLDSLKEPPLYERSFVFGFYAPTLSYCLMIGMMFGFICPLM